MAEVTIQLMYNDIYLNNPWLGAEIEISKIDFNDAWEIECNQVLLIKPNLQTNLNQDNFKQDARETPNK